MLVQRGGKRVMPTVFTNCGVAGQLGCGYDRVIAREFGAAPMRSPWIFERDNDA